MQLHTWLWLLAGLGGGGLALLAAGYIYELVFERGEVERLPDGDEMVRVAAHRLHLRSRGSSGPSVVIEQGAGSPSELWWPLQDRIAEFARACTYDRAGYGWSESVGGARSIGERAGELHTLLHNADVPAPYILVAHSYGGLIVRNFADRYRDEVMALVLVDTPDDNVIFAKEVLRFYARVSGFMRVMQALAAFGLLRCLRQCFPALRAGLWFVKPSEYAAAADDLNSLQRAAAQRSASKPLGSLRTIVITHGRPFPGPFAVLEHGWEAGQRRLADLSTNSDLIVAQDSNHMIHLDQPELVIDAIRRACSPAACGSAQVGAG